MMHRAWLARSLLIVVVLLTAVGASGYANASVSRYRADAGQGLPAPEVVNEPIAVLACVSHTLCFGSGVERTVGNPSTDHWVRAGQETQVSSAESCPTSRFCAAVSPTGLVSIDTDASNPRSVWRSRRLFRGSPFGFADVSCPVAGFCVVVGARTQNGTRTTAYVGEDLNARRGPRWRHIVLRVGAPSAVACATASRCIVAGHGSMIASSEVANHAVSWQVSRIPRLPPATALVSVSCTVESFCAAAADSDIIVSSANLFSSHPRWTIARPELNEPILRAQGPLGFVSVSCKGAEPVCVAAGYLNTDAGEGNDIDQVLTSLHPSGGTTTWNRQTGDLASGGYMSASCVSSTRCYVSSDIGTASEVIAVTPSASTAEDLGLADGDG
jgi:hypothetical protein